MEAERHRGRVLQAAGGVHLDVVIDLWFDEIPIMQRLRLRGVELPKNEDPQHAQRFLENLFGTRRREVDLVVYRKRVGGCHLADVSIREQGQNGPVAIDVARFMLEQGKVVEEAGT